MQKLLSCRAATIVFCIASMAMIATGCNGDDPPAVEENQNQEPNQEEPRSLADFHQLCAAAGTSSDGVLSALHCFGPHDLSGFEASDGELTWQPGAFHIVAQ